MTQKLAAARLAAIAICLLLATPVFAQSDELQEAQQLLKQGQVDRALERVDQFLKTKPKDARGRFLRGILLTEQNKPQEAIKVFTDLTQDYPELPEPYNNLAVLHASQGQYDKARAALEMAIRTHPSYATAHENLGDIYAKMASQAYDKALQLDKGNQGAQTKLNLIKDLFSNNQRPPKVASRTEVASKVAPAPAPTPAPAAAPGNRPCRLPAHRPQQSHRLPLSPPKNRQNRLRRNRPLNPQKPHRPPKKTQCSSLSNAGLLLGRATTWKVISHVTPRISKHRMASHARPGRRSAARASPSRAKSRSGSKRRK